MSEEETPIVWLRDHDTKHPVLVLDESDSVGVALRALKPGEKLQGVEVLQRIPKGHKIALHAVAEGDAVIKYAQSIGVASRYMCTRTI